ncbi:MAG: choice-of-anchor Q domain-containing protein [Gallionellaceae bacterium]|nr:choice-of-anchor Q domain-containing protein [Gallionellaceae bacterium]
MATYYIDYNAADNSANGTNTSTPWKVHPYMQGWDGTYVHAGGDHFIFKGGVTWPSTCFGMTLNLGGVSAADPDYYGVDAAWYSGASWSRPIFSNSGTSSTTQITFNGDFITVDNIEFTGFYWDAADSGMVISLYLASTAAYITIQNCYFHGWTHAVDASDIYKIIRSDNWPVNDWSQYHYVTDCICNGSDSTGGGDSGCFWYGGGIMTGCTISYCSNGFLACGELAKAIGNDISNIVLGFDATNHPNALEDIAVSGEMHVIGNKIHDLELNCVVYFFGGTTAGADFYIYNNIFWNCAGLPAIEIEGRNADIGKIHILNNTVDATEGTGYCVGVPGGDSATVDELIIQNNHFIATGGADIDTTGLTLTSYTEDHNLLHTSAEATAAGYTSANEYQPTAADSPTVNTGTTQTEFADDILSVARPQGAAWDIGAYEYGSSATPWVMIYG